MLRDRGAAQLRPGFADRVLRAAQASTAAARAGLSPFAQLSLSAATLACCLLALFFVQLRFFDNDSERSIAEWQAFALQAEDLDAQL